MSPLSMHETQHLLITEPAWLMALGGRLWVTRDGDLNDYVLDPGQRIAVGRGDQVTVADSAGTLVREIVVGDKKATKDADNAALVASGKWKGSKLEVTATDPRGNEHQETWEVSDGGKTLTIVNKIEARGDRPAMELKRVYRRASA